jgi:hypothetical protein
MIQLLSKTASRLINLAWTRAAWEASAAAREAYHRDAVAGHTKRAAEVYNFKKVQDADAAVSHQNAVDAFEKVKTAAPEDKEVAMHAADAASKAAKDKTIAINTPAKRVKPRRLSDKQFEQMDNDRQRAIHRQRILNSRIVKGLS